MKLVCLVSVLAMSPPLAFGSQPDGKRVAEAAAALETSIGQQPHADRWREYFEIASLQRAFSKSGHCDGRAVKSTLAKLNSDTLEMEMADSPAVVALRQALEEWLTTKSLPEAHELPVVVSSILKTARRHDGGGGEPARRSQRLGRSLIALTALLGQYAEEPIDETAGAIATHLAALAKEPEAVPLVAAVRQYYGHPNVWIDISEDLLDDSVDGTIDRSDPIESVIVGTHVSGMGRMRAERKLVIEPRPNAAVLKIKIQGTINGHTVGQSGPATIHTHTLTRFFAEKSLLLTGTGLQILPAACNAETRTVDSRITTHQGGLRGRIIRRVGKRRAEELRITADRESSQHAQQRLIKSVDKTADDLIKRLDRLALLPILAMGSMSGSSVVVICSEPHVLRLGTTVGPLGAPPTRPACIERELFAVRLHQTLVGRLSRGAVGEAVSARLAGNLRPALAILAPLKALSNPKEAANPPVIQLVGNVRSGRPRSFLQSLLDQWKPGAWALTWIDRMLSPRLTVNGIALRDGQWGTLMPAGLDGEWLAAEWRPPSSRARAANAARSMTR